MTLFEPRDIDLSDRFEAFVAEHVSREAVILAQCAYRCSSHENRTYLVVTANAEGPQVSGVTVWDPWGEKLHIRLHEIGSLDSLTRKRTPLRDYGFTEHLPNDIAIRNVFGDHTHRIWYTGLASAGGGDHVDLLRVPGDGVRIVSTLTSGASCEVEVTMDVAAYELASWAEEEFGPARPGPRR